MGPELFGVGAAEAVLVFVIALILVGPQRFPEIARQSGRWYQVARRYTAEVTKDVRGAIDDLEEEVKAETADLREVRTIGEELETGVQATGDDLDAIGDDVEASTGATPAPAPAPSASRAVSSGTAGPPVRSDKMPPKPPRQERPTEPEAADNAPPTAQPAASADAQPSQAAPAPTAAPQADESAESGGETTSERLTSGTVGPPARSDKMPPKPPRRERPTPPTAANAPESESDEPSENGVSARSGSSSDS
ncbi:MAG TPA: twin-arginine translocase TatA/TatE family subunit [Dehalococcoidia bacterium]|nr:twin-arginine translocase TatA/TatE family subunit [Dehalococcoidia bacterium]